MKMRNAGTLRGPALACLSALALFSAGCVTSPQEWLENGFKVGPEYHKPPAPVAPTWIDAGKDARVKTLPPQLAAWWWTFNDPLLDRLIRAAYEQNLDVQTAGARILQARAERAIAAGQLFPQQQQLEGSYTRNVISVNKANSSPFVDRFFNNWELGATLSWELDFWGRFRRGLEAANAELNASVENFDDVVVILLADVASTYVQLRTLQAQLIYARESVTIQEGSLKIAEAQFKQGAVTKLDFTQATSNLRQTEALIPPLEAQLRQANNRLATLLGLPPTDLLAKLGPGSVKLGPGGIPQPPDDVAVGLPADLLRQRPDVRRAERQLAAQSARVGIAEADLYPAFFLNGTLTVQSKKLSNLFSGESLEGSIGPAFQWNILNYGRILNSIRSQDAFFGQLLTTYQSTVLQANREVEDSLIAFLKSQEQTRYLSQAVEAAKESVEIAQVQYRQGAIDFNQVFTLERDLTNLEQQLAQAQGDIALNLVGVYRALGGGWQVRLADDHGHGQGAAPPAGQPAPPANGAPAKDRPADGEAPKAKLPEPEARLGEPRPVEPGLLPEPTASARISFGPPPAATPPSHPILRPDVPVED